MVKTAYWPNTDAEARRLGEQTGLDTLVVLAVNDVNLVWGRFDLLCAGANALS